MTRFERWFLKRLLRREVWQGPGHDQRIAGLYGLIREACEKEFFEDNAPTLSAFLAECFEQAQQWPAGKPIGTQPASKDAGGVGFRAMAAAYSGPYVKSMFDRINRAVIYPDEPESAKDGVMRALGPVVEAIAELNAVVLFAADESPSPRVRTMHYRDATEDTLRRRMANDQTQDRAGLCTVKELAAEMLNGPRIHGECVCELAFVDAQGRRINMECAVTEVDGVPHARKWSPK